MAAQRSTAAAAPVLVVADDLVEPHRMLEERVEHVEADPFSVS
jgi:hypothetical protein